MGIVIQLFLGSVSDYVTQNKASLVVHPYLLITLITLVINHKLVHTKPKGLINEIN